MSDGAASERRELWLAGTVDAVITGYGLWTVASTLTTVTGTSARVGLGCGSLLMLVLAGVAALPRVRARWLPSYLADLRHGEALATFAPSPRVRVGLVLGTVGVAALWLATRAPLLVWLSAFLLCASVVVAGVRASAGDRPEPKPRFSAGQLFTVHTLALACALLTLLCVRPRTDDPFYINMSVGIADHPERPLLMVSTMHGPATDRLPNQWMFVPYRVHSFEALGGYVSYLTGIDAIAVVHFGLATFFGWFAVLALARLFRIATPRHWLLALCVTLAYYFVEGSAGRGFANQAFVRMFHGKAAMLTALVPLILAYGIRHGLRPSGWRFALLALAQITAMGLTSTAIWLGPILAMVAVVGATPQPRRLALAGVQAALSSGYVLALGLWVRAQISADSRHAIAAAVSGTHAEVSFTDLAFRRLGAALGQALGGQRTALALLCAVVLACALAERAAVCRVLGGLGLVLVALLANPWLLDFVASSITGSLTYERVLWVLPVPVAFGLCASGLAARLEGRLGVIKAAGAAGFASCALLGVATERLVLSAENGATLHFPPELKTSERLRRVASEACRLAKEGQTILASEAISRQLAMQHHCGHPLIAGMRWMRASLVEERRRTKMQSYVTTIFPDLSPESAARFSERLGEYAVTVVVMTPDAMANRPIKEVLRTRGFVKASVLLKHHLYVLPKSRWAHSGQPAPVPDPGR